MFGYGLVCLFLHLVVSVPQPKCRRCCDHLPPLDDAATLTEGMPAIPEVRTYINMTILKGTQNSFMHSLIHAFIDQLVVSCGSNKKTKTKSSW